MREEVIHQVAQLKKLRNEIVLNRREFSEYLGIPLRTMEEWESGRRKMPEYLLRLITYKIEMDVIKNQRTLMQQNSATTNRNVNIIKDLEGNKIVIINDIAFKGKRAINWTDVEEYLRQYVGEFYEIAESEDIVYIGADLPDEYAHSEYTHVLKGANAKAKANAAQGLPELIEIATSKSYTQNWKEKHNKDAQKGWYKYESRFALPVFGENGDIDRYNVFHVVMVVRHSYNGKMYLYDILNIKKETSNLFQS